MTMKLNVNEGTFSYMLQAGANLNKDLGYSGGFED
jgi:hypothetical protein